MPISKAIDVVATDGSPNWLNIVNAVCRIRSRILAEARADERMPWDSARYRLYATIFPQMTLWLPDVEAAQLRLEFEAEMERLIG